MLLDVGPQRLVAGLRPGAQRRLALVRLRRAGLLPQVVELEGHLVVGVEEAAVPQVAVLRDQHLRRGSGDAGSMSVLLHDVRDKSANMGF